MLDRNLSLWGGFVLNVGGVSVYFAGDTGYGPHFKMIREKLGTPDICLLPIGAYEPRWFMRDQHMNPEDAVKAHIDLEAKFSLGTHYGCFQLTNEAIDQPPKDLKIALNAKRVAESEFRAPETGETVVFKK
jgi:L-ascorbate metabolism protein UlaG (beta-lactamase superfamily)